MPKAKSAPVPTSRVLKRGGLSQSDRDAIGRMISRESTESIAGKLRRPVEQVRRYVDQIGAGEIDLKVGTNLTIELTDRPEWAEFRAQYDEEELKFIQYRYVQLMGQFGRDDVLPTEEMQIFALIQLEIMANQAMRERKTVVTQQKLVQKQVEDCYEQATKYTVGLPIPTKLTKDTVRLEGKLADTSDRLKQINARHASHTMQQANLLEALKATRDQRIKVVEGSKASFLGFLKALTQEDFRKRVGDEMETMRVALDRERERMSTDLVYMDGTTDKPLLTPEAVMDEGGEDAL
jgi:hypothetical protein